MWGRFAVPTPSLAPAVCVAVALGALGLLHGGYDAATWSCGTVAAFGVGAFAVGRRRCSGLARPDALQLGLLAAFLVWTAVECLRAGAATRGVPALRLGALYLAALWAVLLVVRRLDVAGALAGVLAAVVGVLGVGLVVELVPPTVRVDSLEGRLLSEPVGYANACGILAALGAMLALGLATHASRAVLRVAAAASLVPLVAALELTASRGAVLAAGAGLTAGLVLDPGRRRLAETAVLSLPLPLAGAWIASASRVADAQLTSSVIARNGRIVAALLIVLTVAQAAVALRVLSPERPARVVSLWLLAGVGIVACGVAVLHAGGALGDRPAYWRVAWADARAHPVLGSGPGSFGAAWLALRPESTSVRNAHNLYLETLAELGPPGLALLVAALAVPLAAVRRARSGVAATAAGAYVAFLVHAGLDWDWQMPVVTVTGLVCGAAVVASARPAVAPAPRVLVARTALVVVAALAALAAYAFVGDRTLAAAGRAAQAGDATAAVRLARAAGSLQPWSAAPPRLLGESYLALGDHAGARRAFARAASLDPRDWRGWYGLARASAGSTRRDALVHVLRLDPLAVRRVSP